MGFLRDLTPSPTSPPPEASGPSPEERGATSPPALRAKPSLRSVSLRKRGVPLWNSD
jgi:hypothetical protein